MGEGDGINLSTLLTEQNLKNAFRKVFKCVAVIPIVFIFLVNNKLGKFWCSERLNYMESICIPGETKLWDQVLCFHAQARTVLFLDVQKWGPECKFM